MDMEEYIKQLEAANQQLEEKLNKQQVELNKLIKYKPSWRKVVVLNESWQLYIGSHHICTFYISTKDKAYKCINYISEIEFYEDMNLSIEEVKEKLEDYFFIVKNVTGTL